MSRFGEPTQPIAAILDNTMLPKTLHKLADAWRAADDAATDADLAFAAAESAITEAPAKDDAAIREAITNGKPSPVPHDQHARQAASDRATAEIRWRLALTAKKDAGDALLAAMVEHREDIAVLAQHAITKATTTYRAALTKAQDDITKAAGQLASQTELLGLLDEIDTDPRNRYEIGAPARDIPRPEFGPALKALNALEAEASDVSNPADRLTVRTAGGRLIEFPRDRALELVATLGAQLVNPQDIDGDVFRVDMPTALASAADRW